MSRTRQIRVAIACGGTGGHFFPGLAVAETLKQRGAKILLLVSRKEIDREAARCSEGVDVKAIPGVGAPGGISLRWVGFAFALCASVCRCSSIFLRHRPSVVLGMGGFTSAPAIIAARLLGIPSVIHESNSIPGRANVFVGRLANTVALSMPGCTRFFPADKIRMTGTPVRADLKCLPADEAREALGLHPTVTTILVMGGSQGAHAINNAVLDALPVLNALGEPAQFIHLCGANEEARLRAEYKKHKRKAYVASFLPQMELAYSAAQIVVSRSGASSLAEIAHYGLPSILVPYPLAAHDHQYWNADYFQTTGAARILLQKNLDGNSLVEALCELTQNELLRVTMEGASRMHAAPHAAVNVANLLLKVARVELAEPTQAPAPHYVSRMEARVRIPESARLQAVGRFKHG